MGATEFCVIARSTFVQVASEEYGIRGRPTSASRVAAMTGLSRKEIARIRSSETVAEWTPQQETTPLNEVLHYWHTDPRFSYANGNPRPLGLEGESSFASLVARYAGDIPAGAMRRELEARDAIVVANDTVTVRERFVRSRALNEDFIRNLAFSLEALCTTLAYNTERVESRAEPENMQDFPRRFERVAWTSYLTMEDLEQFRRWAQQYGSAFIESADSWIGKRELPKESWSDAPRRTVGVGLYYFELN